MSISFKISISDRPVENDYPINVAIRAKRDFIYFRQKVQDSEVQLAYLEAPKVLSHEAIVLNDHIKNYTLAFDESTYQTTSNVVVSFKENLIFTTVVSDVAVGSRPLFFGHKLPNNVTKVTFAPWNKSSDPYIATYSTRYNSVLSDLENYYDPASKAYNCSFVQYSKDSTGVLDGTTINEVYRREPVFREATHLDIDPATLRINTSLPIYSKEKQSDGRWKYTIYGKTNEEVVYYKEYKNSKTQVKMAQGISSKYYWPLELVGRGLTYQGETAPINYDWSETNNSMYFPYYPFMSIKKEATVINEKTVIVPSQYIMLDKDRNIHLTIRVLRNESILFIKTTRPELIGKRISGSLTLDNILRYEEFTGGVDYSLGIVSLNNSIPLLNSDKVIVECVVKKEESEKIIANLNPAHNSKLNNNSILYYLTPSTEAMKSSVHWVAFKNVYQVIGGSYRPVITMVSDTAQNSYIGETLSLFLEDYCVADPYTGLTITNSYKYLPLCTVTFLKDKYTQNVKHKDLRVFAGIKNDLALENKGKDFAFSNILNQSDNYRLTLENQVYALIDKTEIPNADTVNIEGTIAETLGATTIPHYRYGNVPHVYRATTAMDGDNFILNIKLKTPQELLTHLEVYRCINNSSYSSSDILLDTVNYSQIDTNGDTIFSINFGKTISPLPDKLYLYVRWKSGDNSIATDKSPIFCVNVK
jgi:hypothetical protein